MSLDVEVPDPPSLHGPQPRGAYEAIAEDPADVEDDYRREEVEGFLQEGAWQDAFEEWAEQTYLDEAEYEAVRDRGLIDQFDFYWDPASDETGYRVPPVPADLDAELSRSEVQDVEEALDSLGRIVTERLENDYLLRDDETFGFFADDYTGEAVDERTDPDDTEE